MKTENDDDLFLKMLDERWLRRMARPMERGVRGGSYFHLRKQCRVSRRGHCSAHFDVYQGGFRVVRALKAVP